MRARSLHRFALGSALGLALVASSAPASAQFFSFPSSKDPGKLDFLSWFLLTGVAVGATTPQILAGVGMYRGQPPFTRAAGGGIFALGAGLGILDVVAQGFVDPDDSAAAVTLLGGPLWSMAGAGLGRVVTNNTRAPWLGGSIGFTTYATIHGAMAQGGFGDHPPSAVLQSIHAAIGGTGCFINVAYSDGAERWVGIGCGVVSVAAFVHGVVKAARGDVTKRRRKPKRPALMPVPWLTGDIAGLTLAGTF